MAAREVGIHRIDYTKGNMTWIANIAAFSIEDAEAHVRARMPGCRVTARSFKCILHEFTGDVTEMVFNNMMKGRKVDVPNATESSEDAAVPEEVAAPKAPKAPKPKKKVVIGK